jgi:diguanylate cyclase (GGDEF)-like protein
MENKELDEYKKYVQKRLEALQAVFSKASIGDYSEDVKIPEGDDEFTELAMGVQVMVEVIRSRIKDLENEIKRRQEIEDRIRHQALHDHLTGLLNRKALEERLSMALAHASRNSELLAVLYLDIDHFKKINDTYGHHIGDVMLKEIGIRIQSSIRTEDVAGRVGGDEFIVVLSQPKSKENVDQVVKKIQETLKENLELSSRKLSISSSVGIALYPHDGEDVSTLLLQADKALLNAKKTGRNKYCFYSDVRKIKETEAPQQSLFS